MKLNEMRDEAHRTAVDHGWWEGQENIPEKLAMIHSEVSEALEDYRKSKGNGELMSVWLESTTAGGIGTKPAGFGIELADAVIRIGDLCGYLGIDLERAVKMKMEFNKTRPFRHGNKRA